MLTLKLISEETERVISGLEKKHFNGAREAIEQVMAVDKRRREAQRELDQTKQQAKQLAAQIGMLMKQGKRD
ncbi:MAG: serine--tRNA ligase, partial [Prevotella sp.]|nr:serine--tRNA ligase [Prevotella sp.]